MTPAESRQEFESLAQQWLPSIRRFLYLQLGADTYACEEVQQEILLALATNRAGFNGRSQFSTFLFQLTRNKAIDYLRREGRRRRQTVSTDGELDLDSMGFSSDASADPLEVLVRNETMERLFALILELPRADRELLHLREIEQVSEKECSMILGKPLGTLKSRLHRIKKKLFQQMNPEGGTS